MGDRQSRRIRNSRLIHTFRSGIGFRKSSNTMVMKQDPDQQALLIIAVLERHIPYRVTKKVCEYLGCDIERILEIGGTIDTHPAYRKAGKLSKAAVLRIMALRDSDITLTEIGKREGVHRSTIRRIWDSEIYLDYLKGR